MAKLTSGLLSDRHELQQAAHSLKGKVAIVTGGGQGIGKAAVRALLKGAAAVVIAELDAEAGKETEREYQALGPAVFIRTDVSKEASVKKMVAEAIRRFKRIDIIVNNTGIMTGIPVTELPLKIWRKVLDTNLTSIFLTAKHAAPHLRKTKGVIINIGSTRALMSEKNTEPYSASKGGVLALTHALAVSLGPEIRVNCISPGWIEVNGWKKSSARMVTRLSEQDHRQHPAGRVGKPEDIASLVMFLADPENSFITGENFIVDGGMTRKMIYV